MSAWRPMSQGELRELQEHKFLKQLDYVWRDRPFIRRSSGPMGLRGTISGSSDGLTKLPFTEKDEPRQVREDVARNEMKATLRTETV